MKGMGSVSYTHLDVYKRQVSNPLKSNTSYRFTVNAKLEEQVNNVWVSVKKKGTTIPVTQQEQLSFKTNAESVSATATNQTNSLSLIHI